MANTNTRESLRVSRRVDTTADWYSEFGLALWDRFADRLRPIEEPVATIIGSGEMNRKLKMQGGLGSIPVSRLVASVHDNMPESFWDNLDATTAKLYVRGRPRSGMRKLAIGFADRQLTMERRASTRTLGILARGDLRWEDPYMPNLSLATCSRFEDLAFERVVKEMQRYVPDEVRLLPGHVDRIEPHTQVGA